MREIWEWAIREAEANPGETVTVLFAAGDYPPPEPGAFAYRDVPPSVHAPDPGIEMHFTYDARAGGITIMAVKPGTRRRIA